MSKCKGFDEIIDLLDVCRNFSAFGQWLKGPCGPKRSTGLANRLGSRISSSVARSPGKAIMTSLPIPMPGHFHWRPKSWAKGYASARQAWGRVELSAMPAVEA
jgi:hypothetical protein